MEGTEEGKPAAADDSLIEVVAFEGLENVCKGKIDVAETASCLSRYCEVVRGGVNWTGDKLTGTMQSMRFLFQSVALADSISAELVALATSVSVIAFKVMFSNNHSVSDVESVCLFLNTLLGLSPPDACLPEKPLLINYIKSSDPITLSKILKNNSPLKAGALREGCVEAFYFVVGKLPTKDNHNVIYSIIKNILEKTSIVVAAHVVHVLSFLLLQRDLEFEANFDSYIQSITDRSCDDVQQELVMGLTLVSALGIPSTMKGIHKTKIIAHTWLSKLLSESKNTTNSVNNLIVLYEVIEKINNALEEHPAVTMSSISSTSLHISLVDKGVVVRPSGNKRDWKKITNATLSQFTDSSEMIRSFVITDLELVGVPEKEISAPAVVLDSLIKISSLESCFISQNIINKSLQYILSCIYLRNKFLSKQEMEIFLNVVTNNCTDSTLLKSISRLFEEPLLIDNDVNDDINNVLENLLTVSVEPTGIVLQSNIHWFILHLTAVVCTEQFNSEDASAVNSFTIRLTEAYCLTLETNNNRSDCNPPDGIVLLVGLLLDKMSENRNNLKPYNYLINRLSNSLTLCSDRLESEGCFGACGYALALLHTQIADRDSLPQIIKTSRNRLLCDVSDDDPGKQVIAPLLSPLRSSAVRRALASATGVNEPEESSDLIEAMRCGYSSSTPLKLNSNAYFPNGSDESPIIELSTITSLLQTATNSCKPQSLSATDRQGVFNLLQASSQLLWAVTTLTNVADDSISKLCIHSDGKEFDDEEVRKLCQQIEVSTNSQKSHTVMENIHHSVLQLEKYLSETSGLEKLSGELRNLVVVSLTKATVVMTNAHVWTLSELLDFVPNVNDQTSLEYKQLCALRSVLESGQGVESSVLRMLIIFTHDSSEDEVCSNDVVAGLCLRSPKSRQFAVVATAKTAVGQLSPNKWFSELQSTVGKMTSDLPSPLISLLRHSTARLVCRPGQGFYLYSTSLCLNTIFQILHPLLKNNCVFRSYELPKALLTLCSTLPYASIPCETIKDGVGDMSLSQAALKILSDSSSILPRGIKNVGDVVRAWKLRNLVEALDHIAEVAVTSEDGLNTMEGSVIDIVKELLSNYFKHPIHSELVDPVAEIYVKILNGNQIFSPSLCSLLLASSPNQNAVRSIFMPPQMCTTSKDVISNCLQLLPCAGPSVLGKKLLIFAVVALEHPTGLETQREVVSKLLSENPQQLLDLVNGKFEDDSSEQGICKRWLSTVLSGDVNLKAKCREVLIKGLPVCLRDNGFSYLSACAEVCAGSDEKTLMIAVLDVLKQTLSEKEVTPDQVASILPLLEFSRCALSAYIRVDSKGWFSQPAASLADALACMKFTHRAERSNNLQTGLGDNTSVVHPVVGQVPSSLIDCGLPEKFQSNFGCSFSRTREQFVMMHWYLCYSTYANEKRGACSWCAEYYHRRKGFDVEYAGCIPAYCDTRGASPVSDGCGVSTGVLPHEVMDPFVLALFHQPPGLTTPQRPTRSKYCDTNNTTRSTIPSPDKVTLPADFAITDEDVEFISSELTHLLQLCITTSLPMAADELQNMSKGTDIQTDSRTCVLSGCKNWKTLICSQQLLINENIISIESAVDGKLEFDSMPHYEINLLQSRVLTRHVTTSSLCGWIAVVDRSQCVLIVDEASSFIHLTPTPRRSEPKSEISILSKCTARFKIIGLCLNPINGSYMAVFGVHTVQVFVVVGGTVTSQVTPHLALSTLSRHTHVIHCEWIPGSHCQLAVVTTKFVKIFDLSSTTYSPIHNLMLLDGDFCGATFAQDTDGSVTIFCLTTAGVIYSQVLFVDSSVDGLFYLTNQLSVPARISGDSGCSIYYSPILGILCVAYTNGKAFIARWDFDKAVLDDVVPLPTITHDKSIWSINYWCECIDAPGIIACILNDGANMGLISINKSKTLISVEIVTHNLHGTHVEGLSLCRHRTVAPVSTGSRSAKQSNQGTHNNSLCLVASLENGVVCSYVLDQVKVNNVLQSRLINDQFQQHIERQRVAIITARPLPRPRGRRPGGKVTGRSELDRDRDRDRDRDIADEPDIEQQGEQCEALLHGRPFARGIPFENISSNTLRAMLAFDVKWGGTNSNRDIPSTVPLNIWEDLMPLSRSSWAITRGVGITTEDKDKLADGSDLTSVSVGPPRALSRSVEGGTSPTLRGLGISPGTSPCNSPPLSPLSQRSSPPLVGLSPLPRAMSAEGRTPQLAPLSGIGDARPAARFVLQASSDVIVCGVRLRLSCGKEVLPTSVSKSPGETSLPPGEDQQITIRVATQARTLPIDIDPSNTRWLGFVLSHREAMKSPKTGVEVSIITNGPEVTLKQIELFTCAAATKPRYDDGRVTPEPDKDHLDSVRDRLGRGREPISPLLSATSTVDTILQGLVSGRAASIARMTHSHYQNRKREEERREAREKQQAHPLGAPNPPADDPVRSPPVISEGCSQTDNSNQAATPPAENPESESDNNPSSSVQDDVRMVLKSTLDCARLAVSASPTSTLSWSTVVQLWNTVLSHSNWGTSTPMADYSSVETLSLLHLLFAAADHNLQKFRKQRAEAFLDIIIDNEIIKSSSTDSNKIMMLAVGVSVATKYFSRSTILSLVQNPLRRTAFSHLVEVSLRLLTTDNTFTKTSVVSQEAMLPIVYGMVIVNMIASIMLKETEAEQQSLERLINAIQSPINTIRMSVQHAIRKSISDHQLYDFADSTTGITWSRCDLYSKLTTSLTKLIDSIPTLTTQHVACYYNILLCVVSQVYYPPEGHSVSKDDLINVNKTISLILSNCSNLNMKDTKNNISRGFVTETQFIQMKSMTMLLGGSYHPAMSVYFFDKNNDKEGVDKSLIQTALVAKEVASQYSDENNQSLLLELVTELVQLKPSYMSETDQSSSSSNSLISETPPITETRHTDDQSDITASSHLLPPPFAFDLLIKSGTCDSKINTLQPLFTDVLLSNGNSFSDVYNRHTLLAAIQFAVTISSAGTLFQVEEWKVILDSALRKPHLKFIETHVTSLLVLLCGNSEDDCQTYRNRVGLKSEFNSLMRIIKHDPTPSKDSFPTLPIDGVLLAYKSLEAMTTIALNCNENWVEFCNRNPESIPSLLGLIRRQVPCELAAHVLRLCSIAFKSEDGPRDAITKDWLRLTIEHHHLLPQNDITPGLLSTLVDKCPSVEAITDSRVEIVFLLKTICEFDSVLVCSVLLNILPRSAPYGQRRCEFVLSLIQDTLMILHKQSTSKASSVIKRYHSLLATVVQDSGKAVLEHARTPLYLGVEHALGSLKGYPLEGGWTRDMLSSQRLTEASLGILGAEIKYAPDTIFVRLGTAIHLKRVMLLASECRQSKIPKTIDVWYSSGYTKDATTLKEPGFDWQLLGKMTVEHPSHLCRAAVELPLVANAHALKLHFSEFYSDSGAQLAETLTCPSCNQVITDRHGQCLNCEYENAYQCRQCRNINHDQLDAFLCNECGWCRYGRVDFSLLCRTSLAPDVLRNEADRSRAAHLLNEQNGTAFQLAMQLSELTVNSSQLASGILLDNRSGTTSGQSRSQSSRPGTASRSKHRPSATEPTSAAANLSTSADKTKTNNGSLEESVTDSINPSAVSLSSMYYTSARDISVQLAKCLRTQTALRKVINDYTVCGNTTSAIIHEECSDEADLVKPLSRPNSPKSETDNLPEMEFMLPTHFGTLSQLVMSFMDAYRVLLTSGIDVDKDSRNQQGILSLVDIVYSLSLQATEAIRSSSRQLIVLLQQENRVVTERVLFLASKLLLPSVDEEGERDIANPSYLYSAALLLSKCASVHDGLWHVRIPTLIKVFLRATSRVRTHAMLLEAIAQPALAVSTLLLSGKDISTTPDNPSDQSTPSPVEEQSEKLNPLEVKYGRIWLSKWVLQRDPELRGMIGYSWLVELLLAPGAAAVGHHVRCTIEKLAPTDPDLHCGLLKVLTENLPAAAKEGRTGGGLSPLVTTKPSSDTPSRVAGGTESYFSLFVSLIEPLWTRILLTRKGFLPFLCKLVLREVYYLSGLERDLMTASGGDGVIPVGLGWSLWKLVTILAVFIPSATPDNKTTIDSSQVIFSRVLKSGSGVAILLDASLTLKSISAVRTKPVQGAESLLRGILDALVTESSSDKASFLTASISYLSKPRLPCQMGKHILEKVLGVIDPKPPEVVCQILFKKKTSQEDFIRGHMGNSPVSSATVGKTMSDVANRICRELDMQLDPDFGLELLVDSKIIDLKLPIQLVHDEVWKQSSSYRVNGTTEVPMLVVYRLQGLDGEATEERIDNLQEPEVIEEEPSVKYAITECLGTGNALITAVTYVASVCELLSISKQRALQSGRDAIQDDSTLEWEILVLTLTVLHHCCQVKSNRIKLSHQRSLHVLLSAVDVCGDSVGDAAQTALQLLLAVAGSIAGEMGVDTIDVDTGADQHLEFCLRHLEQHYKTNSSSLSGEISWERLERRGLCKVCVDFFLFLLLTLSSNK